MRCTTCIVRARSFLLAGFLLATVLTTGRARAMGAIVSSPPGASSTTDVRVAVSSTGTRTSRWVSLHVHGTATSFAWVVPVKPNAFVDLTSDAWLESLEDATAPRVVPPDVSPACGAGGVEVDGQLSHVVTTVPDSVAIAADVATLGNTLAGWGITVTGDLAPLLEAAGADGDSFVALLYSGGLPDVVTRTVRIVDTSSASLPLTLTSGPSTVSVTAYAFTTGSVLVGSAPAPHARPVAPPLARGRDVHVRAGARNAAHHEPRRLARRDGGSPGALRGGDRPRLGVGPRAHADVFLPRLDVRRCHGGSFHVRRGRVGRRDQPLARGHGVSPRRARQAGHRHLRGGPGDRGDRARHVLRCGGISDDLAVALSGMAPAAVWLTRARSVLGAGAFGADAPLLPGADGTPSTGPVVSCSGYGEACGGGSSSGSPPPPPPGTGSSSGGSGGSSGGDNPDPGSGASAVGDVVGAAIDATSSSDDGCGGDSSGDSSGDSCSSDGGGDSSSAGDGCSGDTGSGDCTLGRARGRHSPTSRMLLLVVALAAVTRRRGRKAAAAG